MLYNNLPIYELKLDKNTDGVYCISLVDFPAIEQDFLVFDAQEEIKFTKVDEEKHIEEMAKEWKERENVACH